MNQACQTRGLQSLRIRPDQVLVFVNFHSPSFGTRQQTFLPVKGLPACVKPVPCLEASNACSVVNPTVVVFLGRPCLPGKQQGTELRVDYVITIKVNVPGCYLM
jgi:hypothetical protein